MSERELRSRLIQIAAELARGQYIPTIDGCRTLRQARINSDLMREWHGQLALRIKEIVDELAALLAKQPAPMSETAKAIFAECLDPNPWQQPASEPLSEEQVREQCASLLEEYAKDPPWIPEMPALEIAKRMRSGWTKREQPIKWNKIRADLIEKSAELNAAIAAQVGGKGETK